MLDRALKLCYNTKNELTNKLENKTVTAEQIRDENKAINEALALRKVGRRERPRRLQFETDYNKMMLDKIFKK